MTYSEFINNVLSTRGRFECGEEYHERHHIKPKCFGGNDENENLIDLFAHEHFIAHKLLALEHPENDGLVYAWNMMASVKTKKQERYELTPEEYEEAKIAFGKIHSNTLKKKWADEDARRQQSEMLKEIWNDMERRKRQSEIRQGTHLTEETRNKIKKSNTGKVFSDEHRKNLSESHKGKIHSKETRQKMSEVKKGKRCGKDHPMYGKHHTEEARQKMSGARVGEKNPASRQVIRLLDSKIYNCVMYAADDNNVCENTMRNRCKKCNGFMYYDEYLTQQNDLENNIC